MPSTFANLADTVLDKTVLPGYSSIGPALRRRWWPADPEPDALRGRHVVVTGASGGLGAAAATGIAALGATVHLVGRKADRLADAAREIRGSVPAADLRELGARLVEPVIGVGCPVGEVRLRELGAKLAKFGARRLQCGDVLGRRLLHQG